MSSPDASRVWQAMGIALIVCVAVASLPAQAPEPIFDDSPPSVAAGPAAARPYVVRSRTATLRGAALAGAMAAPATAQIALNLFDDATFAVTHERVEDSGFGHRSWVGHITGRPLSTVTLTQKDDVLSGLIADGEIRYQITTVGSGIHRIDQLDASAFPPERVPRIAPDAVRRDPLSAPALGSPQASPVVDVLVFYTTALRQRLGMGAVQARAAQAVADANTAYLRSGMIGRLNLVDASELSFPDPLEPESGLSAFRADPGVASQRDNAGADVVALLVDRFTNTQVCGIGYIGPTNGYAFSVTSETCIANYSFAHEVGHNFGAEHAVGDPGTQPSSVRWRAYAVGYKNATTPNPFRTVMAYACSTSCPRVLNFSTPSQAYFGRPTGTSNENNAFAISESFAMMEANRASVSPGPPPPPSAPRNLAAFINGTNITLSWQPPLDGTPTFYRLAAGTAPGASNIGEVTLTSTQFGPFSLPNGTYYARVYAHNSAGSSLASNELPFAPAVPMAPGPPRSLVPTVNGNTVGFTWLPPSTGGAPQGYVLEAGSVSNAANLVPGAALALSPTAASFPGIPPGRYFVRLRARNGAGLGTASNETIVDVGACSPPSAPQNPRFNKANFDVSVFWDAPAAGGPNLTYILEAGSASGAANLVNSVVGPTPALSARVAAGTYFVRIRARTSCGTGPAFGELRIEVP